MRSRLVLNLKTTTSQKYEAVPSRLVFKAHRLVYHLTLGSRVMKKEKNNLSILFWIRPKYARLNQVVVNGGLWLDDPDVDAITRLCNDISAVRYPSHSLEHAGFDPAEFHGVRDRICTTYGPKVDCLRQVDF